MATNTVNVGSGGQIKIEVTETSYDDNAWTSVVRVRCTMINTTGYRSYNNNGVPMSISGSGAFSGSVPFDCPGYSSDLVLDKSFTIAHNSDGTKTVSFTYTLGSTGTTTFGSGGSVAVSLTLTPLATRPDPPSAVTLSNVTGTSVYGVFTDGDNGGLPITARRIAYGTSSSAPSNYAVSDGSTTITGLAKGTGYYFWAQTYNAKGWSDLGPRTYVKTLKEPDAPSAVAYSSIRQTQVYATFSDNANNGAAITERQLGWSTSSAAPTNFVTSDGSTTVTGLPPGLRLYFWARCKNSVGWSPWSVRSTVLLNAGSRIKVGTVWKRALPYQNVNGTWKLLEPWSRFAGIWKRTG